MMDILNIVLPVFSLIALGYLAAATGFLSRETGDGLASYVFSIAIPVLLLKSLAVAEFSDIDPWSYWISYFVGTAGVWVVAALLVRHVFKRGARAAVIAGVAASYSNLVLVGIPLIQRAYGEEGLAVLLLLVAIHLPIMMAASTFLMERAIRSDGVETQAIDVGNIVQTLLQTLLKNPIIIGIVLGSLWRFTGWGISGIPRQIIDLVGQTAAPLALFSVGMGLVKYAIKGNVMPAFLLSFLSLFVLPAFVFLLAGPLLALPTIWVQVAVMSAACPTGVNAYLFATHFKIAEGLAANTIVVATLGAVVTVPFWLVLMTVLN